MKHIHSLYTLCGAYFEPYITNDVDESEDF